ncbi:hypothetical protein GCM10007877_24790 [Marinibactrum halimedae]|uniref:Uncharacterized protein n=1 Tax=Marinibactrum halimedae TaxID=1444977 RepID=A0AA37T4K8_9GAMM|nr:hypothetical protein GCM10007877_24790 [Marinibactrum halimedae]
MAMVKNKLVHRAPTLFKAVLEVDFEIALFNSFRRNGFNNNAIKFNGDMVIVYRFQSEVL